MRIDELPLDEYEAGLVADYRSQLKAVREAFQRLMYLRLEQSPDAEQAARVVANGYELLCAMQSELARIVDSYYHQHLQEHSGRNG